MAYVCASACECVHQKHLAGINGGGLSFDSCIERGAPFSPDVPSKGPRCNSNISAIRFEVLNCQERMMAVTGSGAVKGRRHSQIALGGSFDGAEARGPRYHAAVATVCSIREKLNANGDEI